MIWGSSYLMSADGRKPWRSPKRRRPSAAGSPEATPPPHEGDLAASLNNLGLRHFEAGNTEQAVTAMEGAARPAAPRAPNSGHGYSRATSVNRGMITCGVGSGAVAWQPEACLVVGRAEHPDAGVQSSAFVKE